LRGIPPINLFTAYHIFYNFKTYIATCVVSKGL